MAKTQREEMGEKDVRDSCICPSCPSYVDCGEKAFCHHAIGKSECIKTEQGCLCPACSVQAAMGYTNVSYCTRGSDSVQGKGR